eukprot:TRINITY_DN5846_c1_g1_i2.p1 TRINITY_DN5846_c1_g1~~TRINITY_DN5846_c1_g1_i2.p1  ORF type:complete len:731 (-),score=239.15 TRINITY_DN5846_c1_g1_i2:251-2443(-)
MMKLVLTIICVVFCATGIIQTVENLNGLQRLTFLDSLYFLIVTVTTVGYGDITPESELGKTVTIVFICFFFVVVPRQTSELWQLSTTDTAFRKPYSKGEASHVLVCGDINFTTAMRFLQEFYHEDHGEEAKEIDVVFLSNSEPDQSLRRLLLESSYSRSVSYIIGSALVRRDLENANAAGAIGCFLLSDRHAANIKEEDAATMFRAMAVRNVSRTPIHGLLLGSRTTMHQLLEHVDHLLCVQEAKMSIMAKSVQVPGFCAFIANLLRTAESDLPVMEDADAGSTAFQSSTIYDEVETEYKQERPVWLQEYEDGAANELYITQIPSILVGIQFTDLVEFAYNCFNITIIAVESDFHRSMRRNKANRSISHDVTMETPARRVVLNPYNWRLKSKDTVYVICDDDSAAQQLHEVSENMIKSFGFDKRGAGDRCVLIRMKQGRNSESPNSSESSSQPSSLLRSAVGGGDVVSMESETSTPPGFGRSLSMSAARSSKSKLSLLSGLDSVGSSNSITMESPRNREQRRKNKFTFEAEVKEAVDFVAANVDLNLNVLTLSRRRSLARDATLTITGIPFAHSGIHSTPLIDGDTPDDDVDDLLDNHVIICGTLDDLGNIVKPLRASYLDRFDPIVILNTQAPTEEQWSAVANFPGVYFCKGSPLSRADLFRVRIKSARCVLVMSNPQNKNMNEPQLQDWDAIIVSRDIEDITQGKVLVITDLIHNSNMQFMSHGTDDE